VKITRIGGDAADTRDLHCVPFGNVGLVSRLLAASCPTLRIDSDQVRGEW